ncbi:MAG: diguanylate cyclase [Acidobacteria bacterium]|nr:diguanylate cyclase [Acidobacteriota bacterium]
MHFRLGWISLMLMVGTVGAGVEPPDALEDPAHVRDWQRVDRLNQLAQESLAENPVQSEGYSREALRLAEAASYEAGTLAAALAIGEALFRRQEYQAAHPFFTQASRIGERAQARLAWARALRRSGDIQYHLCNYDQALPLYLQALTVLDDLVESGENADQARLAGGHLYAMLGNLFREMGDLDSALDYYQQSLAVYRQEGYSLGVAGMANNLGNIYQEEGNPTLALAHFQQARQTATELDHPYLLTVAISNMGSAHLDLGDFDRAIHFFHESNEICRQINRRQGMMHNLEHLGNAYLQLDRHDDAVASYGDALVLAEELGDVSRQSAIHKSLAQCFEEMVVYDQSLEHFKKHAELQNRILNENSLEKVSQLQIQFETARRQKEIEALKKDQMLQGQSRQAFYWALVLSLAIILLLYNRYRLWLRSNKEIEKKNLELTEAYQKVEQISRTDALTGLPNRREILARIKHEMDRFARSVGTFALMMADIDNFKQFNDEHGHECGDFVLVSLADHFRSRLRQQDCVGRWGGDEFMFLLPETEVEGAWEVAEKIRLQLNETPFYYGEEKLYVRITAGICAFQAEFTAEECLKRADAALVRGKRAGKNRVCLPEDVVR